MNTRAPPSLPEVQGPFPLHHLCILARCARGAACCAGGAGAVRRERRRGAPGAPRLVPPGGAGGCCVFQVLSFGMDPLFWVCQKAKIWSPWLMEPLLTSLDKCCGVGIFPSIDGSFFWGDIGVSSLEDDLFE